MREGRRSWEQRATDSETCLSGVLFQGLSEHANSLLDDWHAWIVREVLLPTLPPNATVLDFGCGYGRLSAVITRARPDLRVVGQDLALPYCKLFAQSCGPCVLADATQPPFLPASMDCIVAVTSLMYVPRDRIAGTLANLHAILRPDGVILAVDPGLELQTLIARLRGGGRPSPTGGMGFGRIEYLHCLEQSGFSICEKGGNPYLSLPLLIPGVAKGRSALVAAGLARLAGMDHGKSGYARHALHRWTLARRREAST
ncbi:MAG: class I SAM-dependent methyltransferase [Tahibacter sp.]